MNCIGAPEWAAHEAATTPVEYAVTAEGGSQPLARYALLMSLLIQLARILAVASFP